VRDYPFAEVKEMIEELAGPFHQGNPRAAVKMIKEFIPEYISNNSVYRTLDFDFQPGREGVRKAK
jgi:hypothetical protein